MTFIAFLLWMLLLVAILYTVALGGIWWFLIRIKPPRKPPSLKVVK